VDELITSSARLDDERRGILNCIADTVLPATEDGVMPSAGQLDFWEYVVQFEPDSAEDVLAVIDNFDPEFAALPLERRVETMRGFSESEPVLFRSFLTRVYGCYYQHDLVLQGIGLAKGPPFPRGNSIESGDLSLLDPVTAVDRTYRT